jgi:hypothetical protein
MLIRQVLVHRYERVKSSLLDALEQFAVPHAGKACLTNGDDIMPGKFIRKDGRQAFV